MLPVLVGVILVAGCGMNQSDLPDVAPPDGSFNLDSAQLSDLQTMADQEGISLEEAIQRYGWQEPFAMMVEELRVAFPDDFAGARIVDDTKGWVAFRDDPPQAALDRIAAFGRPIEVISGRGFSEGELARTVVEIHGEAISLGIFEDVASGYDTQAGSILVEVLPAEGVSKDAAKEAAEALESRFESGSIEVDVAILESRSE